MIRVGPLVCLSERELTVIVHHSVEVGQAHRNPEVSAEREVAVGLIMRFFLANHIDQIR